MTPLTLGDGSMLEETTGGATPGTTISARSTEVAAGSERGVLNPTLVVNNQRTDAPTTTIQNSTSTHVPNSDNSLKGRVAGSSAAEPS